MDFKSDRTLKVYELLQDRANTNGYYAYSKRTISVPQIRLQGLWLAQCGFVPGTTLNVHCENGKLTITAAD